MKLQTSIFEPGGAIEMHRSLLLILLASILPNGSTAEDLLIAPQGAPRYQLSNIRIESDDFGRAILTVDYKRTKEGAPASGRVQIAGKTDRGPMNVIGISRITDSGQLRIRMSPFGRGNRNFEVYLIVGGPQGKSFMVSNAVRLGNPGPATRPRALTPEERKAQEKAKLYATPPAEIPDQFQAVDEDTNLIPGMPVKAGHYGKWEDAEVISVVGNNVILKYASQDRLISHPRQKWIAISQNTLAEAESNPENFSPSVHTLPGSLLEIPDEAMALDENLKLPQGTPLLYDYNVKWRDVFVVRTVGDKITLRYKGYGSNWDTTQPKSKFLIDETILAKLSDPGISEKFAKNLIERNSGRTTSSTTFPSRDSKSGRRIKHKNYPVRISVPKNAKFVPDDLRIEEGTPLAACWASKWNPITAIYENDDGSLHVHWDDFSDTWNCDMTRDQLIIENKTILKLRRKYATATEDLKKTLRTWTDKSGKHKVEARYVQKTETEVTIMTDAGREIRLKIDKLSEADQNVIAPLEATTENPFK